MWKGSSSPSVDVVRCTSLLSARLFPYRAWGLSVCADGCAGLCVDIFLCICVFVWVVVGLYVSVCVGMCLLCMCLSASAACVAVHVAVCVCMCLCVWVWIHVGIHATPLRCMGCGCIPRSDQRSGRGACWASGLNVQLPHAGVFHCRSLCIAAVCMSAPVSCIDCSSHLGSVRRFSPCCRLNTHACTHTVTR